MTIHLHRDHRVSRQPRLNTLVRIPRHADGTTRDEIAREVAELIDEPTLRPVGLCTTLHGDTTEPRAVGAAVDLAISLMEQVRLDHGLILCELMIELERRPAGHEAELIADVDDALDAACACYRFPRPSVTVITRPTASAGSAARLAVRAGHPAGG